MHLAVTSIRVIYLALVACSIVPTYSLNCYRAIITEHKQFGISDIGDCFYYCSFTISLGRFNQWNKYDPCQGADGFSFPFFDTYEDDCPSCRWQEKRCLCTITSTSYRISKHPVTIRGRVYQCDIDSYVKRVNGHTRIPDDAQDPHVTTVWFNRVKIDNDDVHCGSH